MANRDIIDADSDGIPTPPARPARSVARFPEGTKFTLFAEMQTQWGAIVYLPCGTYDSEEAARADADTIERRDGKATHVAVMLPKALGVRVPVIPGL